MNRIYLDNQSAAPLLPEAREAMRPWLEQDFGSPSSGHQEGLRARQALAAAREISAQFLNASSPEEIIFTSGGTEALNLGIKGTALANARAGRHILLSSVEHPAVTGSVEYLCTQGFSCSKVPVTSEGRVEIPAFEAALRKDTTLACVQLANGDSGTIQDLQAIARITAERGITLVVDATYGAGWVPMDVQTLGLALVAFSPHRLHGPKGSGILYRHRRCRPVPAIHGGAQESNRRAGTENVASIAGAAAALEGWIAQGEARRARAAELQNFFWAGLSKIPAVSFVGPPPGDRRLPNHLSPAFEGIEGEALLLALDMQGVAAASGSACLTQVLGPSPILTAMKVPPEIARSALIFTLGLQNTKEELARALPLIEHQASRLRQLFQS